MPSPVTGSPSAGNPHGAALPLPPPGSSTPRLHGDGASTPRTHSTATATGSGCTSGSLFSFGTSSQPLASPASPRVVEGSPDNSSIGAIMSPGRSAAGSTGGGSAPRHSATKNRSPYAACVAILLVDSPAFGSSAARLGRQSSGGGGGPYSSAHSPCLRGGSGSGGAVMHPSGSPALQQPTLDFPTAGSPTGSPTAATAPGPVPAHGHGRERNVCRHYLDGKCNRGSACRFYHPGAQHRVVAAAHPRTPTNRPITPLADLERQREQQQAALLSKQLSDATTTPVFSFALPTSSPTAPGSRGGTSLSVSHPNSSFNPPPLSPVQRSPIISLGPAGFSGAGYGALTGHFAAPGSGTASTTAATTVGYALGPWQQPPPAPQQQPYPQYQQQQQQWVHAQSPAPPATAWAPLPRGGGGGGGYAPVHAVPVVATSTVQRLRCCTVEVRVGPLSTTAATTTTASGSGTLSDSSSGTNSGSGSVNWTTAVSHGSASASNATSYGAPDTL